MGKTRAFLGSLQGAIYEYECLRNQLIKKYCDNPTLEHYYRNQVDALDQKYEKKFKDMVAQHIQYLGEKDPYGREPLHGAYAKKELFTAMQQKLKKFHAEAYVQELSREVEKLQLNPIIDQPRWAKLRFDNVFHFFKSFFYDKSTRSHDIPTSHETHKKSK